MINHFYCLGFVAWDQELYDSHRYEIQESPSYMVNAGTFRDRKGLVLNTLTVPLRPARASFRTKWSVAGNDGRSSSKVVHAPLHRKVLVCITTSSLPYCIFFSLPITTDATKGLLYQVHLKVLSVSGEIDTTHRESFQIIP